MKKQDIKPFAWGLGVGAIVMLIVIFSAGWVVTSGSAKANAKKISADAVVDRLAREGNPDAIALARPMPGRDTLEFSKCCRRSLSADFCRTVYARSKKGRKTHRIESIRPVEAS